MELGAVVRTLNVCEAKISVICEGVANNHQYQVQIKRKTYTASGELAGVLLC